ncbi:glycosyltransferase family 2 protein [Phenylobacterium sp.]|uniref:glycosyltransferase family 2 protein n=1 Tax=Phenylobacterium sp. TaxID=1871053 RepID=UPI002C0DD117|nr:glycosyltransferase family 2 protein [Phenylobacterium sp.]HLZ75555.1 glycosyltransferase family 2 protein [Phenylobacterium sp.]
MHVAICIVTFRNIDDIVVCLNALAHSTYADFEVVICENGGPEAFERMVAAIPATLPGGQPVNALLSAGNLGYAAGVNRCLREAPNADAWWVLNPDTDAGPTSLAALVARLSAGDCDAVAGTVYTPEGTIDSRAGGWRPWLGRTFSIGFGEALDSPADVAAVERLTAYVPGCCMLLSRRFLETAGPMREDFFLYCEEVEWCLRASDLGLRFGYAPEAQVLHYKGTTTGSVGDMRGRPRGPVYLDERNKILLTWLRGPIRLITVAPCALVLLCLRFGKRRAWRQLGYALAGWAAGLRNERGKPAWLG